MTVVPFVPSARDCPRGRALLDAARAWRRYPGCRKPFPDAAVRALGACGLADALPALDSLMVVVAVHARPKLDLGRTGTAPETADARLMAGVLAMAAADGPRAEALEAAALNRLAGRVGIPARGLLGPALERLRTAARPPVSRAAWPATGRHGPPWHQAPALTAPPAVPAPVHPLPHLLAAE